MSKPTFDDLHVIDLEDLLQEATDVSHGEADGRVPAGGAVRSAPPRVAPPETAVPQDNTPGDSASENAAKQNTALEDTVPEDTASLTMDFIDLSAALREEGRAAEPRRRDGERAEEENADIPRRPREGEPPFEEFPYEEEPADEEAAEGSRRGIPVHLILLVVIVIIAVIAVVRLVIWNQGVVIDIDTEGSESRFNVEVNDSMVLLTDEDLAGAADDGVTTVLCLGNEPFSSDLTQTGLAAQIASLGGVEVINAAFPDSQVTCENATYSTGSLDEMDDIFNLFYVSYAIAIDDYTSLATVASVHDDVYVQAVETLQNTDFSAVDIIAIMYDGIDYTEGMSMQNPDVPEELTTYVGSLYNSFVLLREAYPHIRIVFLSPYYAEYDGDSARTTDLGNGTIVDYFQWAYDTCGSESISFLDNYYGSINENNFEEYLNEDMTLNEAGAAKIADHFVYKVIQGNYAEYNVEELAVVSE